MALALARERGYGRHGPTSRFEADLRVATTTEHESGPRPMAGFSLVGIARVPQTVDLDR